MKKAPFLTIFLLWIAVQAQAQEQSTYLWPIDGAKAGTNIVSTPQSYIGGEQNRSNLYITAPEGTIVLSPVEGIVQHYSITYHSSIYSTTSWKCPSSFDQSLPKIREDAEKQGLDGRYINGSIFIQCTDGNTIHIYGLTGEWSFKTGQKIAQGEPIGRVGYSYRSIREPSINLSISRGGKPADPMTPFGLKTTFIPPAEIKPIDSFTSAQVKEDFLIYIDALKECYPGLYEIISPEEFDRLVEQIASRIDNHQNNWSFAEAVGVILETAAKVHDSHLSIHGPAWRMPAPKVVNRQTIALGWIGDTLLCRLADSTYQGLIGRAVKSVNGIPADTLKHRFSTHTTGYDANVESYVEGLLAYNTSSLFYNQKKNTYDFNLRLEMADTGETIDVKAGRRTSEGKNFLPEAGNGKFFGINRHPKGYELKMINDSIAYLGLSHFSQNQTQVEEIAHFIDSIAQVPYLIIDVRNNSGGNTEVQSKLYSYIAGDTLTLDRYEKVNKQGGFRSFKYALNRTTEDSSFASYTPEPGRDGFYRRSEAESVIRPDPEINYKGKIYMLTNEFSASAATLFPAMLVRNYRGVTVGRETRTAYHFMNALKFVQIRLPNTALSLTIPLVYCHFDSVINERAPFGRGVLPDYEVPLSLEEITYANGDAILNYTLQLIQQGEYLKANNPFAPQETKTLSGTHKIIYVWVGILVIAGILLIFAFRKHNKSKNEN